MVVDADEQPAAGRATTDDSNESNCSKQPNQPATIDTSRNATATAEATAGITVALWF
jgi:hypothetical protein